jgi:60 kDa SS-A/Ro ribonucleoprotein
VTNPFTRYESASNAPVPQTQAADDRQVENNAGGFVFTVSDATRLRRFLILGTDGGTYYQSERDLTQQNVEWLQQLIARDEELVWDTVRDVSVNARAYRNSAAIFALALLFKHGTFKDTRSTKHPKSAKELLPLVCRTGTHLFELRRYLKFLGVNGRQSRTALAGWYENKSAVATSYQLIKYRQRFGWTHRDVLRTAHPKRLNSALAEFAVGREVSDSSTDEDLRLIEGFKRAQAATSVQQLITVLREFPSLPWEAIPTQFHSELSVWRQLFFSGALNGQALVRNVTRLARLGAFTDLDFAAEYAKRLTHPQAIKNSSLHPLNFLNAVVVHQTGQVDRKQRYASRVKNWTTSEIIVDALERGFYLAFDYVEPTSKRTMFALDVSGSMSSAALGLDISCAQVAATLAMATARVESKYLIRGFTSSFGFGNWGRGHGELTDLGITARTSLTDAMDAVQRNNFGMTDCSLPMEWALQNRVAIDTFVVLTDNETYAGKCHPHVALRDYRKKAQLDSRLIVVGMTATNFSIADPTDIGMLDVTGADASLPRIIADFSAGRV